MKTKVNTAPSFWIRNKKRATILEKLFLKSEQILNKKFQHKCYKSINKLHLFLTTSISLNL